MQPLTDEPARRFVVGAVLQAGARRLTCERVRTHSGRLLVTFEEIADRTEAEALTGTSLTLDVDEAEQTGEDDAWFDHQLVGLQVRLGEKVIGSVVRIDHGAGQDLLLVANEAGRQALVPFVRAIVPVVDVEAGFVVLDPPGGLLDSLHEPVEPAGEGH